MLKHAGQGFYHKIKIGLSEPCAFRKLGRNKTVSAIEAVRYNMLAAHGTIVSPIVAIIAFLALLLFFFIGGSHAGY